MTRKFITPVAIRFIKLDLKSVSERLESMGYRIVAINHNEFEQKLYWITCFQGHHDKVSNIDIPGAPNFPGRYVIEDMNWDLFFALAAMSEGHELFPGEWIICLDKHPIFKIGEMYQFQNGDYITDSEKKFRKATKEEIVEHFEKKEKHDDPGPKGEMGPAGYGGDIRTEEEKKSQDGRRFVTALKDITYADSTADGNSFDQGNAYEVSREDKMFVVVDNFGKQVATTRKLFRDATFEEIKTHIRRAASVEKINKACSDRAKLEAKSFFDQVSPKNQNEEEKKQPPLGLMPRKLWEEKRIKSLMLAILRYLDQDKLLQDEWVKELNYLLKKRSEDLPF